ncbi:MAG: DMT family transporter [Holophaga sp.]|nr:DMT family transporter [Holophaga sp.]
MTYLGETASLFTAGLWASNSVFFTLAGRRVGSELVNAARLVMALAVMLALHLVLFGTVFPFGAGPARLASLGVSGFIGFALGDGLLFESMLLVGPRVAMLLMTLSPIFSAVLAWLLLGQTLSLGKTLAILVTLAGIAWVVAEGSGPGEAVPARRRALGLLLGAGGALGQSVGLILSDLGMRGGFSAISANVIRVTAGTAAICVWMLFRGPFLQNVQRLRDGRSTLLIAAGAVTGPVLGVLLSLYAITHASMGVAATLMSLSPVIMLPLAGLVFKERVSGRAVAGTLVSIVGAAALFWF